MAKNRHRSPVDKRCLKFFISLQNEERHVCTELPPKFSSVQSLKRIQAGVLRSTWPRSEWLSHKIISRREHPYWQELAWSRAEESKDWLKTKREPSKIRHEDPEPNELSEVLWKWGWLGQTPIFRRAGRDCEGAPIANQHQLRRRLFLIAERCDHEVQPVHSQGHFL